MPLRILRWLTISLTAASPPAQEVVTVAVRVPSVDLHGRAGDEGPAEFPLAATVDRRIDLASLEVRIYDHVANRTIGDPIPSRWYAAALPDDFPVFDGNVSGADGRTFRWENRRRWGEFFPVIGEGRRGRLAWLHRQTLSHPADYQISYRLLPKGETPSQMPRRDFLGDGSPRCEPLGTSTTGMIHGRLAAADWNEDGDDDLIIGTAYGFFCWFERSFLDRGAALAERVPAP